MYHMMVCAHGWGSEVVGDLEVSHTSGYLFGVPHKKDSSILGSTLGIPLFGRLPFVFRASCPRLC